MKIKMKVNIKMKIKNIKLFKEEIGQGSVEMILLIGALLVIVIVVGNYIFNISESINNSLKILIDKGRNSILYRI